jgi:hypothetical protein
VPTALEEGMSVEALVEFRSDPTKLKPNVRRLNIYWAEALLTLAMTNHQTGARFAVKPVDQERWMPGSDRGETTVPLDGTALEAIPTSFPLVEVYGVLPPGQYDCRVDFSFPAEKTRWWQGDDAAWREAGFWSGTVCSGNFTLDIRRETPKTRVFLVPTRMRIVKELMNVHPRPTDPVPMPVMKSKRADSVSATLPVRNGHIIGIKAYGDGWAGGQSPVGPLGEVGYSLTLFKYKSGDLKAVVNIELYESAEPPAHRFMPGPGSPGYRLLWSNSFTASLSERDFRAQPPESIDFSTSKLTDNGLTILNECPGLERLELGNTDVTDGGLASLGTLKGLELLGLAETRITDATLVHVKALQQLRSLNMSGTGITDQGLANLKDLSRLEFLYLADTQVTGPGMKALRGLKRLNCLNLDQTQVDDSGLAFLIGLPALDSLYLADTHVSDDGLVHLRSMVNLKTLRLKNTMVTAAGVRGLREALPRCAIELK